MSSQSNTSVHWTNMYRKKNLCVGSVVTLFLLRLVVVFLEFFFPEKTLYCRYFIFRVNGTDFSIEEITFFFNSIGYDYPNLSNIPCSIRKWLKDCQFIVIFVDFLQIKWIFSASQVTFIVITWGIVSTLNNYFWVYCIQKKR